MKTDADAFVATIQAAAVRPGATPIQVAIAAFEHLLTEEGAGAEKGSALSTYQHYLNGRRDATKELLDLLRIVEKSVVA